VQHEQGQFVFKVARSPPLVTLFLHKLSGAPPSLVS
jgi:hypothetical protein